MPKHNKIIVCVSTDDSERIAMIQRLLVKNGLALTAGDARKIIRQTPSDFDLSSTYFVAASHYDLGSSTIITPQLFRLASSGILVIVGVKKIKPIFEFMCEAYFQGDI